MHSLLYVPLLAAIIRMTSILGKRSGWCRPNGTLMVENGLLIIDLSSAPPADIETVITVLITSYWTYPGTAERKVT